MDIIIIKTTLDPAFPLQADYPYHPTFDHWQHVIICYGHQ